MDSVYFLNTICPPIYQDSRLVNFKFLNVEHTQKTHAQTL